MPISLDEVSYEFFLPEDLLDSLSDLSNKDRKRLIDEVADYLRDSVLDYVGEAKTPVAKGKYASKLSKDYADAQKSGDRLANLDLYGDMLNALEVIPDYEAGKVTIGIFDDSQTAKAYNHNVGDTLPKRQFIPDEGQNFKPEIIRGVKRIIEDYLDE